MEKLKRLAPYFLYAVIFIVLAFGERSLSLRPFLLGFFGALVYSRQNMLLLVPIYMATALGLGFSVVGAVYALVPPIIILIMCFLLFKLNKPLTLAAVNAAVLLGAMPLFAFANDVDSILGVAVSIVGNVLTLNAFSISLYAIQVRGMRYRLSPQEAGAIFCSVAIVALCLSRLSPYGFSILPIVGLPFILFSALGGGLLPMVVGGVIGIGATIGTLNLDLAGIWFLVGVGASLGKAKPWLCAPIATLCFCAISYLLAPTDWLSIVSGASGLVIYILAYKIVEPKFLAIATAQRKEQSGRSMINRTRLDVAQKLAQLSGIFADMEMVLIEDASEPQSDSMQRVVGAIKESTCEKCPKRQSCYDTFGGDVGCVLKELVEAAELRGRATLLDTPAYLASRCPNVHSLITATNRSFNAVREKTDEGRERRQTERMLAKQMGGVSEVLNDLKKDVEQPVSYDTRLERRLIDELQYRDVKATEAIVYKEHNRQALTLIVAEGDEGKNEIGETINKVLGTQMTEIKRENTINGNITLHFATQPKYAVTYGSYSVPKEEDVSGDSTDAVAIGGGKVMLVLSDGMGTGRSAYRTSQLAVKMFEGFYKAGFSHDVVLEAASQLLTLRSGEEFNAVDLAVVDLSSAEADFIKLGGREGFIVSDGVVEVISGGSLPIGIVDEVAPKIERRALKDGDSFVMVSDGVIDILGMENLQELLEHADTYNPTVLAKQVVNNALSLGGRKDDMSCIVGRMFLRAG